MKRYSSLSVEELIRECAESSNHEPWEEFMSRFHRAISLSVLRTAQLWISAPRQVVEDLIQDTYLKICADRCRLLLKFAVRHPDAVSGYVKTIAVNVVHDHFKGVSAQKRGAGQQQETLEGTDLGASDKGAGSAQAIQHEVLLKQIDECLNRCSTGPDQSRDVLIFWLYYQQGMSAKAIAGLPAVNLTTKGVESVIFRLTRLVRERLVDLRSEPSKNQQPGSKGFWPAESF